MERATNILAQSLADRFTTIMRLLRQTLGAPDYARFDLSLKQAIWQRISRFSLRFRALALNPHPRRPRKPSAKPEPTPEPESPPTRAKKRKLPGQKGWMLQTFPGHHIPYVRGHLISFLEDPDLSRLSSENPRIGRVLRPLCHMLAIPLPDFTSNWRANPAHRPQNRRKNRRADQRKNQSRHFTTTCSKNIPPPPAPRCRAILTHPPPAQKSTSSARRRIIS